MRASKRIGLLALVAVLAVLASACSKDSSTNAGGSGTTAGTTAPVGKTIEVPADQPTIQAAVDAAGAGDLILISPGVYKEAVNVTKDDLTLRGLERNTVVLDGEFTKENGVRVLGANGVAVENMTARNFTGNGFFWTGVKGYRGSYLTSFRTGNYGVYAFDSTVGQLDHIYASGSPDAGLYIGACQPCDALITDVISEYNGLGYSGTNSGGNLLIVNSTFRHNRAGIVPNSGSYELCYPERQTTVVGNLVYENNQPDTPAIDVALLAMGNGILVAGGQQNVIERNRVWGHERTGIGLVPFPEQDANDKVPTGDALTKPCSETRNYPLPPAKSVGTVLWPPRDNRVTDNVVEQSGLADIAVGAIDEDPATLGNCFSGNTVTSSSPTDLQTLAPCPATGTPGTELVGKGDWTAGALDLVSLIASSRPPAGDYKATPLPGDQPNMPDAANAPVKPASMGPMKVDLAAIEVPAKPAS